MLETPSIHSFRQLFGICPEGVAAEAPWSATRRTPVLQSGSQFEITPFSSPKDMLCA